MRASPLQLNQTTIGEVVLQPRASDAFAGAVTVTTTPAFGRSDNDPRQWRVTIRVAFKGADEKPAQYEGHIDVAGVFTVSADVPDDQLLKLVAVTCPSLLYSTAREAIASLTARGLHGVFLLPSVSFADHILKPQPEPAVIAKPE